HETVNVERVQPDDLRDDTAQPVEGRVVAVRLGDARDAGIGVYPHHGPQRVRLVNPDRRQQRRIGNRNRRDRHADHSEAARLRHAEAGTRGRTATDAVTSSAVSSWSTRLPARYAP